MIIFAEETRQNDELSVVMSVRHIVLTATLLKLFAPQQTPKDLYEKTDFMICRCGAPAIWGSGTAEGVGGLC